MKTTDFIHLSKTTKMMKTGGTLNFLKKAGAIFMLLAIFASSCNKYADDFKQLNTKLDALATTVAGVTTLQASITSLATQVTSLQAAVAALPKTADITALSASLAAITTKVDGLTATLKAVADAGTATKAVVDGLKTDLTALAKKVSDDNAAMKLQLTALGTSNDAQTTLLNSLITKNNDLLAAIAASQTALIADNDVTQASIAALQLVVNAQKQILDQLLANSNMYNGDVNLTTDQEVNFYFPYISVWKDGGIINGNVTVNTTAISTSQLTKLDSITNNIVATISGKYVDITSIAANVKFKKLVNVAGYYKVTGFDVVDDALATVTGDATFSYDGPYASTSLTKVGGALYLVNKAAASPLVGTTNVSFPNLAVTGSLYDALAGTANTVSFPLATSVAFKGATNLVSLSAAVATNVTLGTAAYVGASLTINAPKATTVDLSAAATAVGSLTITADAAAAVKLDAFKSAIPVTINVVKTVTMPKYVSGLLTAPAAETVTLAVHDGVLAPALAAVKVLTMGALNPATAGFFSLAPYATLTTATISGKTAATWADLKAGVSTSISNTALATVTLGGNLLAADISGLSALTSLTTGGIINSMQLDGAAVLTSMTFAHSHYVGGTGSVLVVNNCPKLASLSSGVLDYPAAITVTNNALLTSLDLSSYKTKLLAATGATTTITINTNKLGGNYTNATAITPTTPYVETTITSATLSGLKAFVATYPTTAPPALVMNINLDLVTLAGGTATATLAARMTADAGHATATGASFNFGTPANGITIQKEFTLVQ